MTKEIYSLIVRSFTLDQSENSGTVTNAKYRVNWSQILPNKTKFIVKSYFKTNPEFSNTDAYYLASTVNIHTNLINMSSYDTSNQGRSTLLCSAEKQTTNDLTEYDMTYISRFDDSPPIVIGYPTESFLEVKIYDSDGTTQLTSTQVPMDYLLILTFEAIE